MGRISTSMLRMVVFVVVLAVSEGLAQCQALGHQIEPTASDNRSQKPNIVLILVDNLREIPGQGQRGSKSRRLHI
jgi:hypothetical protein